METTVKCPCGKVLKIEDGETVVFCPKCEKFVKKGGEKK